MRAATRSAYGGPDVLTVGEVARPEPGPGELLVRVRATTVSRTDCGVLRAKPAVIRLFTGVRGPRLAIPGTDFAGEVEAVGAKVTRFAVGDRVWGFHDTGLASQAQYLAIGQDAAVGRIPDGIEFAQAVASAEGAHYALGFLRNAKFAPGQQVCVYGGTGAIGSAAIQLLVARGGHVTAFCHGPHMDLVAGLGAHQVVDLTEQPLATYPGRFDLVLDAVGKSTYATARRVLTPSGKYLSSELGPHGQNVYLPLTTLVRPGARALFPIPRDTGHTIEVMSGMLAEGRFRPMIDRHFPLDEIRAAYEYVLSEQKLGNVILDVP